MKGLKHIFLLVAIVLLAGCSSSKYKQGEYNGVAEDNYAGNKNTATAKVTINDRGKIASVYLDTTYTTKDGVSTTKKTLKEDYNMKKFMPEAAGEWYEQVEKLEDAIVENQGISFLKLDDEGKTDAVSGCTIAIDALYKAVEDALEQAK